MNLILEIGYWKPSNDYVQGGMASMRYYYDLPKGLGQQGK